MKKLLIALVFLFVIPSSFAGFYLGAGLGVRPMSAVMDQFTVFGIQINTITLADTEPAVDLSVGYDYLFQNHVYLGLDAFFEFVNIDQSYTAAVNLPNLNASAGVRVRLSDNGGVKLYLGYSPSERVIFYGDLGGLYDQLYYSASAQVVGFGASTSGQHQAAAGEIGLGFLYKLGNNFRLRAEYDYGFYPRPTVPIPVSLPLVGVQTIQFVPKIAVNAVTLGLQYEFRTI